MSRAIDQVYENAVKSGLLPGFSAIVEDRHGNVIYSKSYGKASLKQDRSDAFTSSTICAIASMSKLMTSVAILQCVEEGKLDLDQDLRSFLPDMGKYGILVGFDDKEQKPLFQPDSTPITMRMLLSHTSGNEYDWFNPHLVKWRALRNETPGAGATLPERASLPLAFTPGTKWAYGAGHDWAGKAIEVITGMSLEDFMSKHIWEPLGIRDEVTFFPDAKPSMNGRRADISKLPEQGKLVAEDSPEFTLLSGYKDCAGGAGLHASTEAYHTFVSALFRRDSRLLTPDSYQELFRPQLNEPTEQALNDYLMSSPHHAVVLSLGIPSTIRKSWSFAGMVCLNAQQGRFDKGTTFWGGLPCTQWFMDHEAGICGTVLCQVVPPMHPAVVALCERLQRGCYKMVQAKGGAHQKRSRL
ncbi:hypothetical protein HIM_02994 [Hirsutella minnesotensis 3608]|nr:hypothetical protein HIM_02994 [Hirsutella minnesotensis 3608]